MPQTFTDVACTVCGCVCDDLRVTVAGGRVLAADGACPRAKPWFDALNQPRRPVAPIDDSPVSLAAA